MNERICGQNFWSEQEISLVAKTSMYPKLSPFLFNTQENSLELYTCSSELVGAYRRRGEDAPLPATLVFSRMLLVCAGRTRGMLGISINPRIKRDEHAALYHRVLPAPSPPIPPRPTEQPLANSLPLTPFGRLKGPHIQCTLYLYTGPIRRG